MAINLKISAKQLDPEVNYIPFKTNSRAFTEKEIEEVIRKNPKIFNKLGIYGSSLSLILMPTITNAQESTLTIEESLLNPQIVFEWAIRIGLVGLGASVGFTFLLLIVAATLKQLGGEKRRKKSKEWNTDIIKGFVQVLVAIPLVFALYYLATTIFGQLDFSSKTMLNLP